MGKVDHHLELELLSAMADGELDLSAARNAQEHLSGCEACATQLAAFGRLDQALASPAPISCASALELRSALLDSELSAGEAAVAQAHVASCETCRSEQALWTSAEASIRRMPIAFPSEAVDARIARLTAPAPRSRFPLTPRGVSALAMRGAVAAAVVLAILIGLLPTGAPEQTNAPSPDEVLVAAVQQTVLYTPTNTLYVVQTAAAAVDAMDASTYALRTRITVGGRPTALALDEAASLVFVLDPSQRALVQIDAQKNTVVSTTPIDGIGTPTSVHVDPSSGKVIVAAIPDPPIGGPAPTPTIGAAKPAAGVVAVVDTVTKTLETIKTVDVAPRVVVADPTGKQTLLVSTRATTVVDPSYKTVRTLPGGVAAAFGARGVIAVLAADGPGSAVVYFSGDGAPGPLRLPGVPLAVTSVPEVGFAVLLGSGSGNGRIVVVDEAGRGVGTLPVAASARDLAFDAVAKKFVVVGGGDVASAELPGGVIAAASPSPRTSVPASPQPSASAAPSPSVDPFASPSASPSVVPSALPSASASPGPSASPEPSAVVALPSLAPSAPAGVPVAATMVRPDLYRLDLNGRIPVLTAATLKRVWFLDSTNGLNSIDVETGSVYTLTQLPRDAEISALAIGATRVYAADGKNARLHTFDLPTERYSSRRMPFFSGNVVMTVAPDGRLWVAMDNSTQILAIDPVTGRTEAIETGMIGIVTIAIDNFARVWFSDGGRSLGSYDLRTARVAQFPVPGKGAARALLPDPSGSIWVGTTEGEIVLVRDGAASLVAMTGRPISRLALDTAGVAWYLTPAPRGTVGAVYAPIREPDRARVVPGPAMSLDFAITRAAWIADASGAFYIGVEASK